YAFVTYTLVVTLYTVVNVPYSALMGVMSNNSVERESISTYRFALAFIGAIMVQFFTYYLVEFLGGGDQKLGFQYTAVLYSILMVVILFDAFYFSRERVPSDHVKSSRVNEDLGDLFRNRPWLILCVVSFLSMCYYAIRTGATLYYFKYVVKDESAVTTFLSGASIFLIIGTLSTRY